MDKEFKEYLKQLKEDDYITWDSIVNDPGVVGQGGGNNGLELILVLLIFIIGIALYLV